MLLGGEHLFKCENPFFKWVLAEGVQNLVFFCVCNLLIAFIREVMWVSEKRQKYFFTYFRYFVNLLYCLELL